MSRSAITLADNLTMFFVSVIFITIKPNDNDIQLNHYQIRTSANSREDGCVCAD